MGQGGSKAATLSRTTTEATRAAAAVKSANIPAKPVPPQVLKGTPKPPADETIHEKDATLVERMGALKIKSGAASQVPGDRTAPLPQTRAQKATNMQRVMEHDDPVPGLLTTKQLNHLFALHREDEKKWDAAALAEKFAVEKRAVEQILLYVRSPYWEQRVGMKVGYYSKPVGALGDSPAEIFMRKPK